jgi:hypothetical protein
MTAIRPKPGKALTVYLGNRASPTQTAQKFTRTETAVALCSADLMGRLNVGQTRLSPHFLTTRLLHLLRGCRWFCPNRWLAEPSQAYAEAQNIVDLIRDDAAKAPIKVHRLRGNVSILEGSGGNIAVLTGADGKVFIDAGITASPPVSWKPPLPMREWRMRCWKAQDQDAAARSS